MKQTGGSVTYDMVMSNVQTGNCGMLLLPTLKGGSSANLVPICNCDHNLSAIPQMNGSVINFHDTTGGASKRKRSKSKKSKRKRSKKTKRKSKPLTGGSGPYFIMMKGVCNSCNGVNMSAQFPSSA